MVIADLHIHSKYSRATSGSMNLDELEKFAVLKGLGILGTSDFTHPKWIAEIKQKLKPDQNGFLVSNKSSMKWVLTAEVSNIYSQDGKLRKIHHVLIAPSIDVVEQINDQLKDRGKLAADGRPIFGKMSSMELVEIVMSISKDCMIIPAHIWTPWFSLFGSMSGFDRIEDCYQDQLKHIHALETGLSSDPPMNWRVSSLDNYVLVSNSDCHSPFPWRLGREANVMEVSTYNEMIKAIRKKDPKKFLYTLEVDPNYGKYHYDGHRNCGIRMAPWDSNKLNKICPKCGRHMTIGVLNRVEELADRPDGFVPKNSIPFKRIIPLSELISAFLGGAGIATKKVWQQFYSIVNQFGSEYAVLLDVPKEELLKHADEKLVEWIIRNREGRITISPGFDGVYGQPILDGEEPEIVPVEEPKPRSGQKTLSDF
jgi:uncharacterized protein (TIGR00375 family)